MKKKKMKIACFMLILAVLLQADASLAYAASEEKTSFNMSPIDENKKNSLEIKIAVMDEEGKDKPIEGVKMSIYRTADIEVKDGSVLYKPIAPFNQKPFIGDDYYQSLTSASLSKQAAKQLSGYIDQTEGFSKITGANGLTSFTSIQAGMYLVVQAEENDNYTFDPFIISVPEPDMDHEVNGYKEWRYEVKAEPKVVSPPKDPTTPTKPPKIPTDKPKKPTTKPKTGDDTNFQFLLTLMGVSALGIACIVVVKRKKHKTD